MATVYKLPTIHKDPFDRFLIWEAISNNFILISTDKDIKKYETLKLNVVF
jgi:PIN domain nuclease of toxin-antitoxin system